MKTGINEPFEDVKQFQIAFGHPVGETPCPLSGHEKKRRISWLNEEIAELEAAETVEDQADAIIDLMYFAFGYLVEMGVPPAGVWQAVHRANMAKLWPDGAHVDAMGKVVKSPHWRGPEEETRKYIAELAQGPKILENEK